MALIADILLIAGTLGAAFYCVVLSRRLSKFTNLENGVGGAITGLSAQVNDMTQTLDRAQTASDSSSRSLEESTRRAEAAAKRLELLLASLHDLPEKEPTIDAEKSSGPTFLRAKRPTKSRELS